MTDESGENTPLVKNPVDTVVDQSPPVVEWYKKDAVWGHLYILWCILSIGIIPIIALFDPPFGVRIRCVPCPADKSDLCIVALCDREGVKKEYVAKTEKHEISPTEQLVTFEANCLRFVASSLDNFDVHAAPEVPANFVRFLHPSPRFYCSSKEDIRTERAILLAHYGPNSMSIPETNVIEITAKHALNPIILFGYFAVIIWTLEDYYFYSAFLAAVLVLAIYAMVLDTMFNLQKLRDLAGRYGQVQVVDPSSTPPVGAKGEVKGRGAVTPQADTMLVAGDRIVITPGMALPCDAVLISGRVVMDEAKLTGESVPVAKCPVELEGLGGLPRDVCVPLLQSGHGRAQGLGLLGVAKDLTSSPAATVAALAAREVDLGEKRAGSVLFGGTQVKTTSGECVAVVYRTGFRSSKGILIASLLTPKDRFLRIFEDLIWVIFFLFLIASLLFIYEAVYLRSIGETWGEVVLLYFDALTVAIPVALVVCIIAATAISVYRLRWKEIHVSESSAVNMAGIVSVVCFDKTGTLTDENLLYHGSITTSSAKEAGSSGNWTWAGINAGSRQPELVDCGPSALDAPVVLQEIMCCCQNLSVFSPYAPPVGDLLEVELLRACGWTLHPPNAQGRASVAPPSQAGRNARDRYEILRHFEFTPDRLRASSLVLRPSGDLMLLIKGSPETVIGLCRPDSVPASVQEELLRYTKLGLRVIAAAYRSLPASTDMGAAARWTEDTLEGPGPGPGRKGGGGDGTIVFAGLIILSNRLKSASKPTVRHLQAADILVSMVTGDHVYTAIAVAIEVGILQAPDAAGASNRRGVFLYIVDEREDRTPQAAVDDSITVTNFTTGQHEKLSLEELLLLTVKDTPVAGAPGAEGGAVGGSGPVSTSPRGRGVGTSYMDPALSASSDGGSADEEEAGGVLVPLQAQVSSKLPRVQIAVTGRALRVIHAKLRLSRPDLCNSLVRSCQVFARAKPAEKKYVVEELMYTPKGVVFGPDDDQEEDEVLFCGDGANDMAALRACTVGLSLCDVETSIAAPVTSKEATPGAVVDLLLEGRTSLITTFVLVHYNIMFGYIVMLMTCLLFGYGLMVSDSMYFIQGLFYSAFPGIAIALTPHADSLGIELPPKRYFTPWLLTQLIPQLLVFSGVQVYALWLLSQQSFYTKYATDDPLSSTYSYEATTLANVVLAQLMIASVVSTIGEPYRKEWYTNYWHLGILALLTGWFIYQCYAGTSSFAEDTLDLEPIPTYFGSYIIAIAAGNTVISFVLWAVADRCCRSARKRRTLFFLPAKEGGVNGGSELAEDGLK